MDRYEHSFIHVTERQLRNSRSLGEVVDPQAALGWEVCDISSPSDGKAVITMKRKTSAADDSVAMQAAREAQDAAYQRYVEWEQSRRVQEHDLGLKYDALFDSLSEEIQRQIQQETEAGMGSLVRIEAAKRANRHELMRQHGYVPTEIHQQRVAP